MGRPHIEFIQSQVLPWRKGLYGGARPDVQHRVLSIDKRNLDASLLLRYPAGWKRTKTEHLLADEEFYVLDGGITINDVTYEKDTYAHLPAGFTRRRAKSKSGAIVLTFFSAKPVAVPGKPANGLYDKKRLVEYHNIYDVAWSQKMKRNPKSKFNSTGISLQTMRVDPYTEERTWIFGSGAFWEGGNVEIHPVVEESYMLSGSMVGTFGERKPGGYFWRPPGLEHGPLGTSMGCMMFFRCLGGPLTTKFIDEGTFSWRPKYRPALPRELRRYTGKPYTGNRNY